MSQYNTSNISVNSNNSEFEYENERSDDEFVFLYIIFWTRLFLSSTGVLLNLQVVIIYHSKSQKSPSEYIILNLGCADLLCTIGSTISAIYQFIQSKHEFSEPVGNFADSCQRFSFVAITIYSFICVLVITLNRFLAVCRPHVFRDVFTLPRTYTILVFSALFAVVLGAMQFSVTFFARLNGYKRGVFTLNGYIGFLFTVLDIAVMLVVYVCILVKSHQFNIRTEIRRRGSSMLTEMQLVRKRHTQTCSSTFTVSAVAASSSPQPATVTNTTATIDADPMAMTKMSPLLREEPEVKSQPETTQDVKQVDQEVNSMRLRTDETLETDSPGGKSKQVVRSSVNEAITEAKNGSERNRLHPPKAPMQNEKGYSNFPLKKSNQHRVSFATNNYNLLPLGSANAIEELENVQDHLRAPNETRETTSKQSPIKSALKICRSSTSDNGHCTNVAQSSQALQNGPMSSRISRRTTNVTISLFVISALFIILVLPYKILHLRFLLDRSNAPSMMAFETSLLLFECNFIVNYFVYLYFNSFFRAQLKNFWKMKCSSYQ
ncbi:uncharacterized protein LOC134857320 isoform X1 [Symsagittifera roscoffensis]|uniref:uncharacterized protein LOC134857320 isoform X1 n=1 Tax=Symsagittifera roscoffensis TaxID=84072 RepID=UPI00307B6D1E